MISAQKRAWLFVFGMTNVRLQLTWDVCILGPGNSIPMQIVGIGLRVLRPFMYLSM